MGFATDADVAAIPPAERLVQALTCEAPTAGVMAETHSSTSETCLARCSRSEISAMAARTSKPFSAVAARGLKTPIWWTAYVERAATTITMKAFVRLEEKLSSSAALQRHTQVP